MGEHVECIERIVVVRAECIEHIVVVRVLYEDLGDLGSNPRSTVEACRMSWASHTLYNTGFL